MSLHSPRGTADSSEAPPRPASPGEDEEQCQHALEAAGIGTWIWEIEVNRLRWDARTYAVFGVDAAAFQPTPQALEALIHPEDRARVAADVAHAVKTVSDFNCEYRTVWPSDGSVHFVRTRGKVYRDEATGRTRMTGACWDITQRKTLEQELARERFLLRMLMEHMPDTIYFKDAESRFIRVSRAVMKGFGVEHEDQVLGRTDFDFFSEEHARQAFADEQRIVKTGEPLLGVEEKETWPDGHETWVSTTKLPLLDEHGRIIGTFGLSRDITDRRRAEEQLARYAEELRRRNEELEQDLGMARELQNALMPRQYPSFARGSSPHDSTLRFSHFFTPSMAVSGDFFDIIKLSDRSAGIFICDVMGHGVRAALVAAIIRALVGELRNSGNAPGEFLEQLNAKLFAILKQTEIPMFASASYIVADMDRGELRYANAGHPDPLCIRRETGNVKATPLTQPHRGPVLGMFERPSYDTSRSRLSECDVILQFTDGLFEVESADGEFFDERFLMDAVSRKAELPAGDLCQQVLAEVRQFSANKEFTDDVCLVAMEVQAGDSNQLPLISNP